MPSLLSCGPYLFLLIYFLSGIIENFPPSFFSQIHYLRIRVGKAPEEREMNPGRKTTLELSVRAYAETKCGPDVNPPIGTPFDSLHEAYKFYNLYSWEYGFVVRLAKSRLNVHRKRCMQEILCACAVCAPRSR